MSNGLDDLSGRRRRRQAPPPKHPRSEQQPAPPTQEKEPEPSAEPEQPPRDTAPEPPAHHQEAERSQRSDATRAKRTPSVEAYLDQELMDWLWQIEAAAVARRERSVASPTIRLALRELKKQMSPEQVVEALASRETSRQGRPRR